MSLLEIQEISKSFGGLQALRTVSVAVEPHEIVGIMGANGAGKTTLFGLIAGHQRPSGGDILFEGRRLNRLRPDQICRLGIARTFQIVRPFRGLTVLDNVATAALFGSVTASTQAAAGARAREVLADVGLADRADDAAGALTLSGQKRLEVAKAVATGPKLLMLDEVMAGLTPSEVGAMLETIRALKAKHGLTLLVIEHMMRALMDLSDRIVVLHHGELIAEGQPKYIADHPRVLEAYVGKDAMTGGSLDIQGLVSGYGKVRTVHGIDVNVLAGRVTALVGSNGAGKSTTMRAVVGLLPVEAGAIHFDGEPVHGLTSDQPGESRSGDGTGRAFDLFTHDGRGKSEDRRLRPPRTGSGSEKPEFCL